MVAAAHALLLLATAMDGGRSTPAQSQCAANEGQCRSNCRKQWRWPRTKIKHLLSLGVSLKEAIKTGVSSKGPYAMSRTPITQKAMSNDWLAAQGLVSIKEQCVCFHYPASTA